jgi:hypothetical protein
VTTALVVGAKALPERRIYMTEPNPDFSPEHWLKQAQDVRDKARQMKDRTARAELEAIVRGYERLALHAAKRLKW